MMPIAVVDRRGCIHFGICPIQRVDQTPRKTTGAVQEFVCFIAVRGAVTGPFSVNALSCGGGGLDPGFHRNGARRVGTLRLRIRDVLRDAIERLGAPDLARHWSRRSPAAANVRVGGGVVVWRRSFRQMKHHLVAAVPHAGSVLLARLDGRIAIRHVENCVRRVRNIRQTHPHGHRTGRRIVGLDLVV